MAVLVRSYCYQLFFSFFKFPENPVSISFRSIQSQEFRKPAPRVLAPITDDIFSQQVESDDDYAEDSFCVGDSMVEQDSHYDTLDLLEEQANFVQNPGVSKQKVNQQTSKRI